MEINKINDKIDEQLRNLDKSAEPMKIGLAPGDYQSVQEHRDYFTDVQGKTLRGFEVTLNSQIEQGEPVVYYHYPESDLELCKPTPDQIKNFVKMNKDVVENKDPIRAQYNIGAQVGLFIGTTKVDYSFKDNAEEILEQGFRFREKIADRTEKRDPSTFEREWFRGQTSLAVEGADHRDMAKESLVNRIRRRIDKCVAQGFVDIDLVAYKSNDEGDIVDERKIGVKKKYFDRVLFREMKEAENVKTPSEM